MKSVPYWPIDNKYKFYNWYIRAYNTKLEVYEESGGITIETSANNILEYLQYEYQNYDKFECMIYPSSHINYTIAQGLDYIISERYETIYDIEISKTKFDEGFCDNVFPKPANPYMDYIFISTHDLHKRFNMCKYQ